MLIRERGDRRWQCVKIVSIQKSLKKSKGSLSSLMQISSLNPARILHESHSPDTWARLAKPHPQVLRDTSLPFSLAKWRWILSSPSYHYFFLYLFMPKPVIRKMYKIIHWWFHKAHGMQSFTYRKMVNVRTGAVNISSTYSAFMGKF